MNEGKTIGFEIGAVAASLSMTSTFGVKDVMARISDLLAVEAKLPQPKRIWKMRRPLSQVKEATIQNMQKDLDSVNAKLSIYERRRLTRKKPGEGDYGSEYCHCEGKIENRAKNNGFRWQPRLTWLKRRELRFRHVKPSQREIADDPANVDAAKEAAKTAEEKKLRKSRLLSVRFRV